MKIIIVEDEMLIAQVLKIQLNQFGYEVLGIARNERSFWSLVDMQPDLILMDVKLKKEENGINIAKKFRKNHPKTPIIFTTGNSRNFVEHETISLQNIGILNKPIVFDELNALIQKLTI